MCINKLRDNLSGKVSYSNVRACVRSKPIQLKARNLTVTARNSLIRITKTIFVLIGLIAPTLLLAQSITVAPASTQAEVQNYVENVLLGSCVTASNITFSGTANAAGTFDGTGTVLGLNGGIVLTSGRANLSVGPDNANSTGFGNGGTGDPDLTVLAAGFQTYDAAILEFDFIPQSDTLRFNYIFGSEEYPEYVNSGYNDVFGFFISGPGIAGPFSGGAQNIALIPGTNTPVAIDNVNNGYSGIEPATGPCDNCQYYVDNSNGPAVQYDAHTTVLTAEVVVTPCQTYHIKIAIADAGDGALDSGVFLEAGSFSASGEDAVELAAVTGVSGVYEGCDIGTFVFRRLPGSSNNSPLTVGYNVSGTATPGVDYTALPGSITIPAGQDSIILNIQGVLDFTPEGIETVVLDLVGGGCTCTAPPSISMNILDNDTQLSLSTIGTTTICLGQSASLMANPGGSIAPYTSGWDNGAAAGNNVTVSPTTTTTYTYTVTDVCGGQSLSNTETVTVVTPDFTVDDDQQCLDGNSFSFLNTGATGGTVTHFWDFGDGNDSNFENPTYSYANPGNYTVTHSVVYIAAGCTASASALIRVFPEPSALIIVDQNVSCTGSSDGALNSFVSGGTTPYTYLWSPNNETTSSITGLSPGTYGLTVTDINGCTDGLSASIIQNDAELPQTLCQDASVQLNASGTATISATLIDNGSSDNCGIASLVVSPNVFTCAEVGANAVVLTVTDVNGNVSTCNATVTVIDPVPPIAVCQDLTITLDAAGNATIVAADIDNGSSDNCAIQSISVSQNTFTCADLGANTVTLSVTDGSGNTATCDATVTVLEDTDPIAVCQNVTVQLDVTGNVSVTGAQLGGASTDNCAVDNISVNPADFSCADIGDNSVSVTVFDSNGNSASCTAVVTVEDALAPNALCQDITAYLDVTGNTSIVAADIDAGSTDNCAIDNISATPTSFTCAEVGLNAVVLTVTDVNGNVSTCNSNVNVQDTISPIALCQDVTVQLDGNGTASVVATDIDNGSTDNCGSFSTSITPNSFDCTVSSPGTVELTVTDAAGNSSTCSAIVNLVENSPPTAVCQNVIVQLDASGNASIVAADVDGGSSDNCGVADLTVDPANFDCSNIGDNTVTLTAADANGNTSTCNATVTVQENVDPVAVCQNITIQLDAVGNVSITAADVDAGSTDNCAISSFSVTPNSFSCTNLGTTIVTLTVTDAFGNTSTCNSEITVEDNVPPTAICQEITVQLDANGSVAIVPSQIDNGSNDICGIASLTLDITDFDCSDLGSNTVVLTVVDNSGNSSTCSAQVSVEDGVDPNAVCQNLTVYLDENGVVFAAPADVENGSTDNCAIASLSLSQTDFNCADLGQAIITLTVEDQGGNTDDCISVFTVLDTVSPIISACPADIIVTANSADCTPSVTWPEPSVTDNCTVSTNSNFSSGDSFPVGTTTVVYAAVDQSGNTASCSFDVTVQATPVSVDISSPVGICGYNVSCNGSADAEAIANVTGGCSPYSFAWSDGQITQTATGLDAGQYVVVVTDANGTSVSDTIELTQPEPLVTDSLTSLTYVGGANVSCVGLADGSIYTNILGGSDCESYTYSWEGPNGFISSSKDPSDLEAGIYTLTVTDVNGCELTDSIELTEPSSLDLQAFPNTYNGFGVTCFGDDNGAINLEVSGGTSGYSYSWSNGESVQDIDSLTAGTYNVLVTDTNGCEATLSVVLDQPTQIQIVPTDTVPITCNGASTGQFVVAASGGIPAYSYLWSNGDIDPILNVVGAGIYTVVVTDLNGCQDSLQLQMLQPTAIDVAVLQVTNATCFGFDDGNATISASGGTAPYNYSWSPTGQNSVTATGLSAGEHVYTVTDANGCTNVDTIVVAEPDQIILVTSNDTTICPGTVVALSVEASGGGGTYLITWANGQGFGNTYEPYVTQTSNIPVVAVDQNGCQSLPNSVIVTTYQPAQASFGSTVVDQCSIPFQVDFSNTSTNASSYSWSFGNGDVSSQFLPSTSYDSSGTYLVTLVAQSSDGCFDSVTSPVNIQGLPEAAFSIPNPEACYPIFVGFFSQSSGVSSYFWQFGDGETSTDSNPYNFYDEPGAYTVTLIVTNQFGCTDTLSVDSAVVAFPQPTAAFIPIQTAAENGREYNFINQTQGATEYLWAFGNGDYSELFEPTYTYPEAGSFDIVLRAFNEYGCLDTARYSIDVELISGLFVPNAMVIGDAGDAGVFLPKGAGLANYHAWIFDLWGNQLWESTALIDGSPAESWDGRYKGELVPQGAYTWKIEAVFKDGVVWEGMVQEIGKPKNIGSVTVLF